MTEQNSVMSRRNLEMRTQYIMYNGIYIAYNQFRHNNDLARLSNSYRNLSTLMPSNGQTNTDSSNYFDRQLMRWHERAQELRTTEQTSQDADPSRGSTGQSPVLHPRQERFIFGESNADLFHEISVHRDAINQLVQTQNQIDQRLNQFEQRLGHYQSGIELMRSHFTDRDRIYADSRATESFTASTRRNRLSQTTIDSDSDDEYNNIMVPHSLSMEYAYMSESLQMPRIFTRTTGPTGATDQTGATGQTGTTDQTGATGQTSTDGSALDRDVRALNNYMNSVIPDDDLRSTIIDAMANFVSGEFLFSNMMSINYNQIFAPQSSMQRKLPCEFVVSNWQQKTKYFRHKVEELTCSIELSAIVEGTKYVTCYNSDINYGCNAVYTAEGLQSWFNQYENADYGDAQLCCPACRQEWSNRTVYVNKVMPLMMCMNQISRCPHGLGVSLKDFYSYGRTLSRAELEDDLVSEKQQKYVVNSTVKEMKLSNHRRRQRDAKIQNSNSGLRRRPEKNFNRFSIRH